MSSRPAVVLRVSAGLVLAFAAVGLAGPALGAAPAASAQDKAFLVAAHQSNLTEITSGKAAQKKAKSKDVKDLGEMLVADHTKLDATVKTLAKKYGVSLPTAPNAQQRAGIARVAASGSFDQTWTTVQLGGHLKSKANGAKELSGGKAADVLTAARTAAPVVQSHIDELTSISKDLGSGVPAGVDGGTGGQAAANASGLPATPFLALGALLLAGAGVMLLRRRSNPAGAAR